MTFKFCPECGRKLDKSYKFCPECGFALAQAEEKLSEEPVKISTNYEDILDEVQPLPPDTPEDAKIKKRAKKWFAEAKDVPSKEKESYETLSMFPVFLQYAEKGDADFQYYVGRCYYKGLGVKTDDNLAFEWFRKSASRGNAGGQHGLGLCFLFGYGVKKDIPQGIFWIKKSAMQDFPDAHSTLGDCYGAGLGVPQDHKFAMICSMRAVATMMDIREEPPTWKWEDFEPDSKESK